MAYRVSINGQVARREDGSEDMTQEDVYEMDVTPDQDRLIIEAMHHMDEFTRCDSMTSGSITVERIK